MTRLVAKTSLFRSASLLRSLRLRQALLCRLLLALALFSLTVSTESASAQPATPGSPTSQDAVAETSLQAILKKAESLEQSRKWADVIRFYESVIKEHPRDRILTERLSSAKMHYDIARRYRDRSFVREQLQLTPSRALDLYTEVLNKIDSYYVDRPEWTLLIKRGIRQIEIALEEPSFRKHHRIQITAKQIGDYQREMKDRVDLESIERVSEVRQAAWTIAYLAHHYLGMTPQSALLEFTAAATTGLDRYSSYLTPHQLEEVFSQIDGNFVGLGVELKASGDALEIVQVIPGGPAAEAGLKEGDKIVAVAGKRTGAKSLDDDADRLRGPENTEVEIVVGRAGRGEQQYRIMRRRVEVPSVDRVQMLDDEAGIAYFRLVSFQKTTGADVDRAMWKLHRQGMRTLIIDLRGNPGGLLTAAVDLADKFLDRGTIVSTRGRSAREDYDYMAHSPGTWRISLIVLIDGNSASASEIFAGAIADHDRGTIVGQRSYGKGSVQGIFPLGVSRCGLRLTTAKFYAPSGRAISHAGVTPDIVVRQVAKPSTEQTRAKKSDPEIHAALQVARDQVGQR